jgi:hypothetical protein
VFWFCFQLLSSRSKKNWARYDQICGSVFVHSTRRSSQFLMKPVFSRQFFDTDSNFKLHENSFREAQLFQADGRTDGRTSGLTWRSYQSVLVFCEVPEQEVLNRTVERNVLGRGYVQCVCSACSSAASSVHCSEDVATSSEQCTYLAAQRCTTQAAFKVWPPKSGSYLLIVLLMMGILVPETCLGYKTAYFVAPSWFFTFHSTSAV